MFLSPFFGPHAEYPETFNQEYKLEIFNWRGDKLYESNRIVDRWNGRVNNQGEITTEEVYMYIWSL